MIDFDGVFKRIGIGLAFLAAFVALFLGVLYVPYVAVFILTISIIFIVLIFAFAIGDAFMGGDRW